MHSDVFPHIIHKQVIELVLSPELPIQSVESRVKQSIFNSMPEIEMLFSQADDPNTLIRINELNIDLGVIQEDQLESQIGLELCRALSQVLQAKMLSKGTGVDVFEPIENTELPNREIKNDGIIGEKRIAVTALDNSWINTTGDEGLTELFYYFLQNGVFPWWADFPSRSNIEQIFSPLFVKPSHEFVQGFKRLLAANMQARQRLIFQFSKRFNRHVLQTLKKAAIPEVRAFEQDFQSIAAQQGSVSPNRWDYLQNSDILSSWYCLMASNLPSEAGQQAGQLLSFLIEQKHLPFEQIREYMMQEDKKTSIFSLALKKALQWDEWPKSYPEGPMEEAYNFNYLPLLSDEAPVAKPSIFFEGQQDKSLFVAHAGLVLLHPFLPALFGELGLLGEGKFFLNDQAQTRAVYLLAFLATGETDIAETELPFCKFLCGMPIQKPVLKVARLKQRERHECVVLLEAVIRHWNALKNTSPEALRDTFLNRKGKLDFRETPPVLFVEKTSFDFLLDRLPWGINFIQLPWADQPITIFWN